MSALRRLAVDGLHRAGLVGRSPDVEEPRATVVRRRAIVVATLVAGSVLLGFSLNADPGSTGFYVLTLCLAAVWAGGALLSGPLHLGRQRQRRPVIGPIVLGFVLVGVFVVGALVVREIGPLDRLVQSVLDLARQGTGPLVVLVTVLNGIAEEVYFRGALYAALGRYRPVLLTAVIYTVATLATGNLMLAFAALVLAPVLGLQRRATGGILASTLTHITWSVSMIFVLPPLF
ncbi:CPBP family intramembrane glutamic endopeptidase [Nakamurella alba]|uniref:CPBP family intramembrane glutamic endopeptidase n=1 Tax=Nakamurella alba TaxID=2665158 RepID=UPI002AC330C1|nr:type II CAAX endopeptidase family protein [Nakamurella alba]